MFLKMEKRTLINLITMILISANYSLAQLIIEQVQTELPISYEMIPEDMDFESEEAYNEFVINLSEDKLKKAAVAEGKEVRDENMTIYLDGDNMAVETESEEDGKISMISNISTGIGSIVMWSEKKIMEINYNEMAQMNKGNESIGYENDDAPENTMEATGKKKVINGYSCEEYTGYFNEETITIWAANDESNVLGEVNRISKRFSEMFRSEEDEQEIDEWKLVEGKIPIQVRTLTPSMMGEPNLNITTISKIEKSNPPKEKFRIPGEADGFTKTSMMDLMQQMMEQMKTTEE